MIVMVMYSAWVCPYEIAFLGSNPTPPLYIADNVVDIFFAVDIILTFFVAYIDSTTQLLVLDSKKIAKRLVLYFLPYSHLAFYILSILAPTCILLRDYYFLSLVVFLSLFPLYHYYYFILI